jgi:ABC-2 type transport system permease protein
MDWNQLRTILWLRWRLTRNQWSRGSPINAILSMIVACATIVTGMGGAVFGLIAGVLLFRQMRAQDLLAVWDVLIGAFLFFWAVGLISDIQRSETIDIGRMLHLPVSLKQIFFINYLASHLTFSIILFVPGMLGLSLGLALGRGWLMLGLLPLVVGSVFMVTSWTYCLRGWLVALMSNPRRRRTVVALMAFIAIMVGQLPNLVNIFRSRLPHQHRVPAVSKSVDTGRAGEPHAIPREVLIAHQAVPFLWVGNGAMGLAQGNVLPALWGAAASFGIGALGLRRAYRSTLRFYRGYAKTKDTSAKAATPSTRRSGVIFVERRLPGIPEEAAATALATLRSLMRAPEVKMALAMNVFFLLAFGATPVLTRSHAMDDAIKPFLATGTVAFMCFSMVQLLANQFGYDRAGFRALVLCPAPRRWILLGKNLALMPIVLTIGAILLLLVKFAFGIPTLVIAATGLQLLAVFLFLSMAGNLMSVLAPYRVIPGSLKHTKMPAGTLILTILLHGLFPLMVAPAFMAPIGGGMMSLAGWLPAALGNLLISSMLLALAVLLYYRVLPPLGGLLARREKKILDVVTHEVE